MQLVESYVNEVSQFLPQEIRAEIRTELKASIEEEVQERAASCGRDVSETDVLTVLAGFGHPLKVASRYQPARYLIGPDLYPIFLRTLRLVIMLAIVAQIVVTIALGQLQNWQIGLWELLGMSLELLFWVVAVVTSVFLAIEYSGEKLGWYASWKPSSLSHDSIGVIDRTDVITGILSEGFFLLWFNDVVTLQGFLPAGAMVLETAPVWETYFWHLNALFAASFLLHVYALVKGVWHRPVLILHITLYTAMLGLGAVLIGADNLVILEGALSEEISRETGRQFSGDFIDRTVRIAIAVIMLITVWDVWSDFRLLKGG